MVSAAQIARTIAAHVRTERNCYGNSYLDGIDAAAAELAAEFEAVAGALERLEPEHWYTYDGERICNQCGEKAEYSPAFGGYGPIIHWQDCPFAILNTRKERDNESSI